MDTTNHYDELMRQIKVIHDRVRGVICGNSTGMYLHGRPGTSKTYMVRSTLDRLAVNYTPHSGHLTPIGLFNLLDDNRDRIIVLDDVSSIFNQSIALQILLASLGNPHDGSGIRYIKHQTANGSRVVPFSGGVICLSNLALNGHHDEVLAALRDRINVIHYEPTDEQISALILKLAGDGVGGVPPKKSRMVAVFLIGECKTRGIRPSVRLFVDKALKDFQLWNSGNSETDWRDLVRSNLEQQVVELQHDTRDLSRAEQVAAERRVALDVYLHYETKDERVAEWEQRTGKSQAAFYRRLKELKSDGKLDDSDAA